MIDSNDALILALRTARLSRSIPMGSIDSAASRILALRADRLSHHVPSISIRSLQLIQAFGRPSTLPWAPVRNWSSLFLNRMSDVWFQICISAPPASLDRYSGGVAGHVAHPIRSFQISDF